MMKTLSLSMLLVSVVIACKTQPKFTPTLENTIYDSAKLLTPDQRDSILSLVRQLNRNVGSQMAVITINNLNGRNIDEYSLYHANKLGIGRRDFDDGILFTVAVQDRRMRIEVGLGLELIIKDEFASAINKNVIAPQFLAGNFGRGIYLGLDSLKRLIEVNRDLVGRRVEKH